MPKINKDFSDALGFKTLTSYTEYSCEFPVEGAKIQKIYDDNFRETCFKCYPIIAQSGVDPISYSPKRGDLKSELRKQFPILKTAPQVMIVDDTDEDETVSLDITLATKPTTFKSSKPLTKEVTKTVSPVLIATKPKCSVCAEQFQKLQVQGAVLTRLQTINKKLEEEISAKNKAYAARSTELTNSRNESIQLRKELTAAKNELQALKGDPEFMAILDYQKKKRRFI